MEFRGLMAFGAWRYGLAVWPYGLTATYGTELENEFRTPAPTLTEPDGLWRAYNSPT